MGIECWVRTLADSNKYKWLLGFYVLVTLKVISGWVIGTDSADSWYMIHYIGLTH